MYKAPHDYSYAFSHFSVYQFQFNLIKFYSTVSSGVNSLSVIVLEDIVKKIIKKDMPDKTTTLVSKLIGKFDDGSRFTKHIRDLKMLRWFRVKTLYKFSYLRKLG